MKVGLFCADSFDIIDLTDMRRVGKHSRKLLFFAHLGRCDHHHRTLFSKHLRQKPRIDIANTEDSKTIQKFVQRLFTPEVGGIRLILPDDNPFAPRRFRLHVFRIATDVADLGHCEGNKLSCIAGIGYDLLISRHRSIEDDLSDARSFGTEALRFQKGTVFQIDIDWLQCHVTSSPVCEAPLHRGARK